jgi:hypothetical protein
MIKFRIFRTWFEYIENVTDRIIMGIDHSHALLSNTSYLFQKTKAVTASIIMINIG